MDSSTWLTSHLSHPQAVVIESTIFCCIYGRKIEATKFSSHPRTIFQKLFGERMDLIHRERSWKGKKQYKIAIFK